MADAAPFGVQPLLGGCKAGPVRGMIRAWVATSGHAKRRGQPTRVGMGFQKRGRCRGTSIEFAGGVLRVLHGVWWECAAAKEIAV